MEILPFVLIWLIPIGYLWWRRHRAERLERAWIEAGQGMGLRFQQRVVPVGNILFEWLAGERGGGRVELWSSVEEQVRTLHAKALFDRPAMLRLHASTRPSEKRAELFGPKLRSVDLPGIFVHAHDEERAKALLWAVRKTLVRYPGNGRDLAIDDEAVTVSAAVPATREEIEALLDDAVRVRRRVAEAVAKLGPSAWEKEAVEAWREIAGSEGLLLDDAVPRIDGTTDRFEVAVELVQEGSLGTRLTFTFRSPLRGSVNLGRGGVAVSDALLAIVGQLPAKTGDATFDARFHATSRAPEAAKRLLDDPTRAALLALPEAIWGGELGGDRVILRADGVLGGDALRAGLRAMDRLAPLLVSAR